MRTNEESIRQLATFLKLLEETLKDWSPLSLTKECKDCNLPNYIVLPKVLIKKGILTQRRLRFRAGKRFEYKWVTSTNANLEMARAVAKECIIENSTRNNYPKPESHPDVTDPIFKVLLTDQAIQMIRKSQSIDELQYLPIIVDNGCAKVKVTILKAQYPSVFKDITNKLILGEYEDHITHVELKKYHIIGQIVNMPQFMFKG